MKLKKFESEQIKSVESEALKLPFCYIRRLSEVCVGKNNLSEICYDELLEARFFDETQEYRIFGREDKYEIVYVCDEKDNEGIRFKYYVENIEFGSEIDVCNYIETDEDGQCFVYYTRLCGWEK